MGIDDLPVLQKHLIGPIAVVDRAELFLTDGRHLLCYVAGKMDKSLVYASSVVESAGVKYIEDDKREYVRLKDVLRYVPLRPMLERVK